MRGVAIGAVFLLAGCGLSLSDGPGSNIQAGLTEPQWRACSGVEVHDRANDAGAPQPQAADVVEVDATGKTIERAPPPREEVSVMAFSIADLPRGERKPPLEQGDAPQATAGPPPKELAVDVTDATCFVRFADRKSGLGRLRVRDAQATSARGLSVTRGDSNGCILSTRWETFSRETNTYEIVDGWIDAKTCAVSAARRQPIATKPLPGLVYFSFLECGERGCDAPHMVLIGPSSHAPEAVASSSLVQPDRADLPFLVEQLDFGPGQAVELDRLVGPQTFDAWLGRRKRHQMVALRVGIDVSQGVSEKAPTAVFHAAPFVPEPRGADAATSQIEEPIE